MGDVYCRKCGEPWDTYHLRHDEIWETDLRDKLKEVFPGKLTLNYRKAFERIGWVFGDTIFNIKQCPCCKNQEDSVLTDNGLPDIIEELCGDDLDAIQTEIEDLQ